MKEVGEDGRNEEQLIQKERGKAWSPTRSDQFASDFSEGREGIKLEVTGRSTVRKQAVSQPQDNLFSELEPGQSQWRIMLWEPWW